MSEHAEEHEHKKAHASGHGGGHGGGGHEEAHEGAPEWLISFADNVTLMMGFFVILLAINMAQPKGASASSSSTPNKNEPTTEMLDAAIAIREAFNNPVDINSPNPNELPMVRRILERSREGFSIKAGLAGNKHDVQSIRPSGYARPCALVSFESHSCELSKDAKHTLANAVGPFKGVRTILEIRGHVSSEEASEGVDKGMKLSFDRALTAARELVENGLDWRQLRIVSCTDNDRLAPVAYDPAEHHKNQRAEVYPTDEIVPNYVAPSEPEQSKK